MLVVVVVRVVVVVGVVGVVSVWVAGVVLEVVLVGLVLLVVVVRAVVMVVVVEVVVIVVFGVVVVITVRLVVGMMVQFVHESLFLMICCTVHGCTSANLHFDCPRAVTVTFHSPGKRPCLRHLRAQSPVATEN